MKRKLLLQLILLAFGTFSSPHVFAQLSGYYQQDFEGTFPPDGWQTVDVLDPSIVWEKSNLTYPDHYSGLYSAHINYTDFVQGEDWLILPQFTVAATDSFSFWLAADFLGYPPDSTVILVSTTDANLSSFTTELAVLWDDTVGTSTYPPAADLFQYYAYSLSAFSGQNIYVAIRNRNNFGDGVFVDLVTIGTPPAIDAAAISIDVPNVVSTVSSIPKATVKNNSFTDQSFSVTMTTSGGYTSTQAVTNLAAGTTQQIDFDPWAPLAGDVTISIQTQLVGDEIPGNDILLKVVTAYDPLSVYYQQDFEGAFPPAAWQTVDVLDPNSVWDQSSLYAYSGSKSASINYAFYVEGEDWLILPQFTVAPSDSFSFWLAVNFPGGEDSTYILVSTTDADPSSFTTVLATLSDGDNYPSNQGQFQYYAYSLSAFAGQNIYVAFKNRNFFGDDVFVDLVTIGTHPALDAFVTSIDVPEVVSTAYSIVPKATVKNNSLTDQSFSVTMNISGGYSSTQNVTNLAAGATQQVDFDLWTPPAGNAAVSVLTQLGGDEIPGNDSLSKVVTATPPLSGYYQEDFEGTFPPLGWQTVDVLDHSEVWEQSTNNPFSGNSGTYLSYSPIGVQGEDWLILPQWSVAASDSFSFWLAVSAILFPPDSTDILISTTDAYTSSFTNVLGILSEGVNYPTSTSSYNYYAFSLAAYAGQNIYVGLRNRNIYGDGIYVDLTSIGTPLATTITQNTAVSNDLSSFPNPFTKSTSLSFSLDQSSAVKISIVDVMGREVETLCNKILPAGAQQITWNASEFSAGVYFCKINVNGRVTTQKLVKLN